MNIKEIIDKERTWACENLQAPDPTLFMLDRIEEAVVKHVAAQIVLEEDAAWTLKKKTEAVERLEAKLQTCTDALHLRAEIVHSRSRMNEQLHNRLQQVLNIIRNDPETSQYTYDELYKIGVMDK